MSTFRLRAVLGLASSSSSSSGISAQRDHPEARLWSERPFLPRNSDILYCCIIWWKSANVNGECCSHPHGAASRRQDLTLQISAAVAAIEGWVSTQDRTIVLVNCNALIMLSSIQMTVKNKTGDKTHDSLCYMIVVPSMSDFP
jgi:hypothetical protein